MTSSVIEEDIPLRIVVIGATGDLAQRKIFPALFGLFRRHMLPPDTRIVGLARSGWDSDKLRDSVTKGLSCYAVSRAHCSSEQKRFLALCSYVRLGQGDDEPVMSGLLRHLKGIESGSEANYLFYLAVPPSSFKPMIQAIEAADLVREPETSPWTRVVIEKPFGRDRSSSDELSEDVSAIFDESQIFRIDHYLGKDVVQDLMVLRFANTIFEPIWNRNTIAHVHVIWKENFDLKGRAGYFDGVGIIRDVMQNHLTQIVALLSMERPDAIDSHAIRNAKVNLLRDVAPISDEDIVCGQYQSGMVLGEAIDGYLDDDDVPESSCTPTYAAAVLHINNERWRGVPFLISAGKGLDAAKTEIQIHFRSPEPNIYGEDAVSDPNDLVIRIQPEPAIRLKVCNKVPGMGMFLDTQQLDLNYWRAYGREVPDAYEGLIVDVIKGDRSLFIRSDELAASWDIFTPLLHRLDEAQIKPLPYAFGATGPAEVDALALRYDIRDARQTG